MDSLDIRIIREMLESKATSPVDSNVRRSLSSIARKLRVDENTQESNRAAQEIRLPEGMVGWY